MSHPKQYTNDNAKTFSPWLKHYPEDVPHTITIEEKTLLDWFRQTCQQNPENIAYLYYGDSISYAVLFQRVIQISERLQKMGVKAHDRVLLCLPNIPASPLMILATLQLGATVVMTNPLLAEPEHAYQLKDCGATLAVVLSDMATRFAELRNSTPLETVISCQPTDVFSKQLSAPDSTPIIGGVNDFSVFNGLNSKEPELPAIDIESTALLLYTGGTTGLPKAVNITHRNISANIQQINAWLPHLDSSERALGLFPFFSGAGFVSIFGLLIKLAGSLILIPRPTPETIIQSMSDEVTILPGVPTIYQSLLQADIPSFDIFKKLKFCASGAAPLPRSIHAEWLKKTGQDIVEFYGLTETTAMIFGNPYKGVKKAACAGMPIPNTECKIVSTDVQNTELRANEIGEVCVRGPQIANGYLNQPIATKETFINGWLFTGDLGYLDDEGSLFIVDRKKEMIISSGYNVYPREIEEILLSHPDITEAAAIGVADNYRGESIKAFIASSSVIDEEDLDRFCRKQLASYKLPREYIFMDSLPRGPLGKVLKHQLPS